MILVTGASGTVGREVVKALAAQGVRFRAGYRSRPANVPSGVDAIQLDFDKPETLPPALKGVDTVYLLSSLVGHEANVVRAAKGAGVGRIVKHSVLGAADEAFTFAKWHRAIEREVEASGLPWTFIRPTGYMQNVVNFMAGTIKGQSAIYTSAAEARISHVDVRDIAAVTAKVLAEEGHDGKAYTLTGPAAITAHELAKELSVVLGREIKAVPITGQDYKKGAMAAGMPEGYADALVDLERFYREGGSSTVSPAIRQLIGRDPIDFGRFARDHADALR